MAKKQIKKENDSKSKSPSIPIKKEVRDKKHAKELDPIKKKRKFKQSTIAKREIKKLRKISEPTMKYGSSVKLLKKIVLTEYARLMSKSIQDISKDIHISAGSVDILRHEAEEFVIKLLQHAVIHSARISSNKKVRKLDEPPFVKSSDIAFIAQIKYPNLISTGGLSTSEWESLVYNYNSAAVKEEEDDEKETSSSSESENDEDDDEEEEERLERKNKNIKVEKDTESESESEKKKKKK
jgi:hypothetical protein